MPIGGGGGASSSHYTEHSSSGGGGGGIGLVGVYPVGGVGGSSSHFSEHSSSSGNQGLGAYGTYPSGYGLSSRYSTGSGFGHTSSGLAQYISESERLAQLQAQSGGGIGSQRGSSTVNFSSGNSLGGNLGGGYGKVKSWETSSKWGSQSEVNPQNRFPNIRSSTM